MPGYILHLTAAKIFLNNHSNQICANDFLLGNLLPDTVKDKSASHFRNPIYRKNLIEYPDLELFKNKYGHLLERDSVLGYFYHLYIDRKFFKEYLPSVICLLDEQGQEVRECEKVVWVHIKRTGETLPYKQFYSEEYYYGDFTKMNTYLVERFQIPLDLHVDIENPGIEEVDYGDVRKMLEQLDGDLHVPVEAVWELKVFEMEELLEFLLEAAREFLMEEER